MLYPSPSQQHHTTEEQSAETDRHKWEHTPALFQRMFARWFVHCDSARISSSIILLENRTFKDMWQSLFTGRMLFPISANGVKALEENQSTQTNQVTTSTSLIPPSSTTGLLREGAWLPLCRLSNACTLQTEAYTDRKSHRVPRSLRYTGLSMTLCPPWIIWATVSLKQRRQPL